MSLVDCSSRCWVMMICSTSSIIIEIAMLTRVVLDLGRLFFMRNVIISEIVCGFINGVYCFISVESQAHCRDIYSAW